MGGVATRPEANAAYRHLSQRSDINRHSTTPTSPHFVGGVATRQNMEHGRTWSTAQHGARKNTVPAMPEGLPRQTSRPLQDRRPTQPCIFRIYGNIFPTSVYLCAPEF